MEGQGLSKLAAKLITRSKARVSVGHRKLVNYLDNISRDETGAPVRWTFNKTSVKIAKGISKQLAKVDVNEKKVKRLQSKPKKMEDSKGGKSKTIEDKGKKVAKKGRDSKKSGVPSDSLIISIRRLDNNNPTSPVGATQRIVTFRNTDEGEPTPKKVGRKPKIKNEEEKIHTPEDVTSGSSQLQKSEECDSEMEVSDALSKDGVRNESEKAALKSLEQEVAIKRGRSTATWTTLNQRVMKRGMAEKMKVKSESKCRDSSEGRVDSDLESVDSNVSVPSERKRKYIKKPGVWLGPRKLLRSQDSLITRGMKMETQVATKRRKRTLSGEFDLLDEKSLKKKLREEQDDDGSETDTTEIEHVDSESEKSQNVCSKTVISGAKTVTGNENNVKPKARPGRPRKKPISDSVNNKIVDNHDKNQSVAIDKVELQDNDANNSFSNMTFPQVGRGRGRGLRRRPGRPSFKFLGTVYKHADKVDASKSVFRGRGRNRNIISRDSGGRFNRGQGRGVYRSAFHKQVGLKSDSHIEEDLSNLHQPVTANEVDTYEQEKSAKESVIIKRKNRIFKFGTLTIIGPGDYEVSAISEDEEGTINDHKKEKNVPCEIPPLIEIPQISDVNLCDINNSKLASNNVSKNEKDESSNEGTRSAKKMDLLIKSKIRQNKDISPNFTELPRKDKNRTEICENTTSIGNFDKQTAELMSYLQDETHVVGTSYEDIDISLKSEENVDAELDKSCDVNSVDTEYKYDSKMTKENKNSLVPKKSFENKDITCVMNMQDNNVETEKDSASSSKDSSTKQIVSSAGTSVKLDTKTCGSKDTRIMDNVVSSTDSRDEEIVNSNYNANSSDVDSSSIDYVAKAKQDAREDISLCSVSHSSSATCSSDLDLIPNTLEKSDTSQVESTSIPVDGSKGKDERVTSPTTDLKDPTLATKSDKNDENNVPDLHDKVTTNTEVLHTVEEPPGLYFHNVDEIDTTLQTYQSVVTDESLDGSHADSYEEVISVQVTHSESEIDKDENSSSSELSPDRSSLVKLSEATLSASETPAVLTTGEGNFRKRRGQSLKKASESTRKIQLRQKASRSPLEIIAMRQCQEEKQYLMEQSRKASKREEKLKRRQRKFEIETEVAIEMEGACSELNIENDVSMESEEDSHADLLDQCKPCSVVLIDFVKYLKMNESSHPNDDSCVEDEETTEENTEDQRQPDAQDGKTVEETSATKSETVGVSQPRKKRKPSARKQARSYNFKQKFTAEIVNYPLQNFDYNPSATVPPLRLKIKPNVLPEPKKRGRAIKRKARKSFSPSKIPSKQFIQQQETVESSHTITASCESKQEVSKDVVASTPEQNKLANVCSSSPPTRYPKSSPVAKSLSPTMIERKQIKEKIPMAVRKEGKLKSKNDATTMKYECTFNSCGFQASLRDVIKSHIYVHLKNTPFKCLNCDEVFKTRTEAFMHSRNEHQRVEVMIEPAEFVDETLYFKHINGSDVKSYSPPASSPSTVSLSNAVTPPKQILQAEVHQVEQSPEAVIIKVVLPHQPKGCYCCSYCNFTSSVQQEILSHINENHRPDIQYTCTICECTFLGSKEGIANHFAQEHPNQPILYKSMPEFYDVGKTITQASATVTSGPDKGNIFDRMSDLFSPQEQAMHHGKKRLTDSTSAEADSTTAESDLVQGPGDGKQASVSQSPDKTDGIEELGKAYSNTVEERSNQSESSVEKDASDDMGLKIVEVVSLCDQEYATNAWNETPQDQPGNKIESNVMTAPSVTKGPPAQGPVDAISALRDQYQSAPNSKSANPSIPDMSSNQQANNTSTNSTKSKSDLKICTTYKCEKCNVHAPVLASMVEHLRISHKDIEKLFLCPYCRQYEGATEPDIHRHIKQFHQQNKQQKSPPVALSSAAKQHLRTIQVPAGDANKIGDKFVIEKDIYKCLKCNGHMPSLDFIYTHLEKQHNEFFVNVCPYCKVFKSKDEEVVFNHIRQYHNRSTDEITLSVAIEENLFTRVQCLIKSKPFLPQRPATSTGSGESASPLQTDKVVPHSQPYPSLQKENMIAASQMQPMTSQSNTVLARPAFPQQMTMRPNIPMAPQSMRMPPSNQILPQTNMQFTQQAPSKSSLRKSRPQHRDRTLTVSPEQSMMEMRRLSMSPQGDASGAPPPLLRAPPPLIRFQNSQLHSSSMLQSVSLARSSPGETLSQSSLYAVSDRLQRQQAARSSTSPQASADSDISCHGKPVLRVPSVRPSLMPSPRPPPPPYDVAKQQHATTGSGGGGALDLSKALGNEKQGTENEADDMPPDAFQIFNIRPGSQPSPEEKINYNQFQVRPNPQMMQRMRYPMGQMRGNRHPIPQAAQVSGHRLSTPPLVGQRFNIPQNQVAGHRISSPRLNTPQMAGNQGIMYQGYDNPLRPFTPRSSTLRSPEGAVGSSIDRRVFKCPYCTHIVPLNMGEVAPHIEKFHPGHSIVFSKLDA